MKQRYGAELRNKTLASMKTEISQAISSLLEELASIEDAKVFRARPFNKPSYSGSKQSSSYDRGQRKKSCTLCKAAGRPANSHWLSQCSFLPPEDKKSLARLSRGVEDDSDHVPDEHDSEEDDDNEAYVDARSVVRRVGNIPSPVLDVEFNDSSVMPMTLDSGATSNLIRESYARRKGIEIHPNTQYAGQADGVSQGRIQDLYRSCENRAK